jgi:hypothetical protein
MLKRGVGIASVISIGRPRQQISSLHRWFVSHIGCGDGLNNRPPLPHCGNVELVPFFLFPSLLKRSLKRLGYVEKEVRTVNQSGMVHRIPREHAERAKLVADVDWIIEQESVAAKFSICHQIDRACKLAESLFIYVLHVHQQVSDKIPYLSQIPSVFISEWALAFGGFPHVKIRRSGPSLVALMQDCIPLFVEVRPYGVIGGEASESYQVSLAPIAAGASVEIGSSEMRKFPF